MNKSDDQIGPLKKVSLSFELSADSNPKPLTLDHPALEFIFGIGTTGLTQVECELAGKKVGDIISMEVKHGQLHESFGHIPIPSLEFPRDSKKFYLHLKIHAVSPVDQREVIKAMADLANCGDHCCGD